MNSKLIKGSIAGVAVVALVAGGSTFAGWSDFYIDEGNTVGADVLALSVDESASRRFDDVKLAPGVGRDLAFYVASRNGETVPAASLTMTIENLVGTENGCDSNSERLEESGDCNDTASGGEFADQALYYIQAAKSTDPASCTTSTEMPSRLLNTRLSSAEDLSVDLLGAGESLAGGEGVCVLAHVFMPNNVGQYGFAADNKSQGDSAKFDVRFDLVQMP